ncbi:hypothetical protein [Streptomyces xanthii]|nr:hypothetical protein [Streptomyces xanthii]
MTFATSHVRGSVAVTVGMAASLSLLTPATHAHAASKAVPSSRIP